MLMFASHHTDVAPEGISKQWPYKPEHNKMFSSQKSQKSLFHTAGETS